MTISLIVELTLAEGQKDNYINRARQHRANVLKNETGCQRFDLVTSDENADMVYLYEVYDDEAALEIHMNTDYMAEYRADTGPMIADRKLNRCTLANE